MKNQISKLILLMVPIMLLFSCNKDKFSEKDALNAQQTVDLIVTVIDQSSSMAPVDGATVILINDSTIVTKTTNANGIVSFANIQIGGSATISVSKTDFTSVLKSVYTNPDSYRQTQVSTIVSLYSLESSKIATFKGRLTMQSDLTDRDREPAVGFTVKAKNFDLSFTGQLYTAVTDADGNYSIAVPVTSNGDDIQIYYPEFTVNQTVALVKPDNSIGIVDRSVLYKSATSPIGILTSIDPIPSIYATIAAPPAIGGSGFALSSQANREPISNSSVTLVDGGAGYAKGRTVSDTTFTLSPDPDGVSAQIQVDITSGRITHIDWFVDNGATYSEAPTLEQNGATTAAVISINFVTTYKVYISNRGTGYTAFPSVSVETESYVGGIKVIDVEPDISIFGDAVIYGGEIKGVTNGDTLIAVTADFYSSAPVFTAVNNISIPAILSVNTGSIDADSTLNSITIDAVGSGYNPDAPPAVTLTTLAGYGSDAVAKAVVNTSGEISDIVIVNHGMGYVKNVNDYRKDGEIFSTYDNPDWPTYNYSGIKPGEIIVHDVYYGTGYQVLNKSTGK